MSSTVRSERWHRSPKNQVLLENYFRSVEWHYETPYGGSNNAQWEKFDPEGV
jgi:hypothetical protein